MFTLSVKGRYGITAMLELAENHPGQVVQSGAIADKHALPKNYLEQIFNRLGKHGLVRSIRGKNGGYTLAEPPESITILRILEALEGELALREGESNPVMVDLYGEVETCVRKQLSVSLAWVLEQFRQRSQQVMFHI